MNHSFLAKNDVLIIRLYGARDPLAHSPEAVRKIIAILASHDMEPDTVPSGKTERPFSLENAVRDAGKRRDTGSVSLTFLRHADPPASISMMFLAPTRPLQFLFKGSTALARLADPALAQHMVALLRELAGLTEPLYGLAHSDADFALSSDPHTSAVNPARQVYEPYWLNLYGKAMVDAIGRDRIASTPATSIEWLPSGAALVQIGETPVDFAEPAARRAQAAALVHLRGTDLDTELARLEERSRKLAPVEPTWPPEVADLFEQVLDLGGFSGRQQETARLNALNVTDPDEWRPATEQLPADVDTTKALDRYATYAEQLVALVHSEVPKAMKNAPEALPDIDFHVWLHDYPTHANRRDIENDLVPAVGGYIGQMLVDRLGGRWVPRKKLDESQVVLGNRAWLPFLRARHYLVSRNSVLTHSLTQFFRAAQREAKRA